jgi:hypothetical protein
MSTADCTLSDNRGARFTPLRRYCMNHPWLTTID